ncbi:hypothetical protein FXO37_16983 [Capsicum annuum]|nr:hypothetical protein FXO37_16983 [Capsicum annuum]
MWSLDHWIWEDILGFENAEFYIKRWPQLDGAPFKDVLVLFPEAIPCGVKVAADGGKIIINPDDRYVLKEGDEVLVIAEDDDTYAPGLLPESNESGDIDHNQDKFWGKLRFDQRLTWNKRPPGDFTGDYKIDKQIQFSAVWFGWEERDSCTSGSIGKTETVVMAACATVVICPHMKLTCAGPLSSQVLELDHHLEASTWLSFGLETYHSGGVLTPNHLVQVQVVSVPYSLFWPPLDFQGPPQASATTKISLVKPSKGIFSFSTCSPPLAMLVCLVIIAMELEASNSQPMDNNPTNIILVRPETMSRDMARLNAGLEKLDLDMASMIGRLE